MKNQEKHKETKLQKQDKEPQELKKRTNTELREKKPWKKMELRAFQIAGCLVNAATGS